MWPGFGCVMRSDEGACWSLDEVHLAFTFTQVLCDSVGKQLLNAEFLVDSSGCICGQRQKVPEFVETIKFMPTRFVCPDSVYTSA